MTRQTHRALEPGLGIELHANEISLRGGRLPTWTLVSQGLAAFGQREVVITIPRAGAFRDAFPEGVIGYIPVLKHFATQKRFVGAGEVSGYRAPGPFGFGDFVGITFIDAVTISGIDLPGGALAGVFLTEGELAMAGGCSVTRVLNALGKQARYFPAPYWSDPARGSVYAPQDCDSSLLTRFNRARVDRATATLSGETMSLVLPAGFASVLADRTEAREVTAVLPSGRADGVTAALVWSQGQTEPEAIFADGTAPTAFAATFVALVPNDGPQDDVRFMEDGYAVLLSKDSANRVVAGLRSRSVVNVIDPQSRRTLTISVSPAS